MMAADLECTIRVEDSLLIPAQLVGILKYQRNVVLVLDGRQRQLRIVAERLQLLNRWKDAPHTASLKMERQTFRNPKCPIALQKHSEMDHSH
jgi:hypothetical protein